MHISLTSERESGISAKVESSLYNNASEVAREASRPTPSPLKNLQTVARHFWYSHDI